MGCETLQWGALGQREARDSEPTSPCPAPAAGTQQENGPGCPRRWDQAGEAGLAQEKQHRLAWGTGSTQETQGGRQVHSGQGVTGPWHILGMKVMGGAPGPHT